MIQLRGVLNAHLLVGPMLQMKLHLILLYGVEVSIGISYYILLYLSIIGFIWSYYIW